MLAYNNENFYPCAVVGNSGGIFLHGENATVKIIFSHFKEIEEQETIKKKLQRGKDFRVTTVSRQKTFGKKEISSIIDTKLRSCFKMGIMVIYSQATEMLYLLLPSALDISNNCEL